MHTHTRTHLATRSARPAQTTIFSSEPSTLQSDEHSVLLERITADWPRYAILHGAELRALILQIPEPQWAGNARIIAAIGASYRSAGSGRLSTALPYLEAAEKLAEGSSGREVDLATILLQHAACLRGVGLFDDAAHKAQSAAALLGGNLQIAFPQVLPLQAEASTQLGLIELHSGNLRAATAHLELAAGLGEPNLSQPDLVECLGALALVSYLRGDFDDAERFLDESVRASDSPAEGSGGSSLLHSNFGTPALATATMLAVDRCNPDEARAWSARLATATHANDWEPLALYARAVSAGLDGELVEALGLQRRAVTAMRQWQESSLVGGLATTLKIALQVQLGAHTTAAQLLEGAAAGPEHISCPGALLSRIRFNAQDYAGARAALEGCLALGDEHSSRTLVDVLVLSAAVDHECGDVVTADISFDRALHLARNSGTCLPFLTLPRSSLLRMLARATTRHQPVGISELLTKIKLIGAGPRSLHEELSERELQVARLLHLGRTHAQIANELFISTNTVKTHVRSVYRKLSAASRDEAIRRMRELGIIEKITPH